MALIFPRVARNFIKNGYFPTDEETLTRILSALIASNEKDIRVIDPCCGEGVALAEVSANLSAQGSNVISFGVEYDEERAYHSKTILDRCIHSDLNDCNITPKAFSLLWLNPPYGDLVGNTERSPRGDGEGGRKRLEKEFSKRCFPLLQANGILVLIVPYTILDREFAGLISRNFSDIRIFAAPEQQFRQAVIFGVKKSRVSEPDRSVVKTITQARENLYMDLSGNWVDGFTERCVLPKEWHDTPYVVPPTIGIGDINFYTVRLDEQQLQHEVDSKSGLWERYDSIYRPVPEKARQPLKKLSPWHLALMLAAGQISGVVRSNDGARTLVVKGDTYKSKEVKTNFEYDENGNETVTKTSTDKFVPLIRALDFTPGPSFGRTISIK